MSKGKKQFQLSQGLAKSIQGVLNVATWLGSAVIVAVIFLAKLIWGMITWTISSLFYLILRVLKKDFKKRGAKSYKRGSSRSSGRLIDNLKNGSSLGLVKFLPARAARRKLLPGLVVILVFLTGFAVYKSRQATDVRAGWFNDRWGYRKKVTITNGSGGELTDFQVEVTLDTASLITAGKMQSDCDDLRITDVNGKVLPHWIEEDNPGCNDAATKIWFKHPILSTAGASIYVYYGNSSVGNTENGDEIFEFFDDFNDGVIDSTWTQVDGTWSESGGVISKTGGGGRLRASLSSGFDYIVETKLRPDSWGTDYRMGILSRLAESGSLYAHIFTVMYNDYGKVVDLNEVIVWGTPVSPGFTFATGTWYNFKTSYIGTDQMKGKAWQVGTSEPSWQKDITFSTSRTERNVGPYAAQSSTASWDNFRVRKYSATEPTAGSPAAEEVGPGPVAYWKFDEGYGTTANDYTSNNHNGTLTSGPSWQNEDMCISGKCLGFDGADDYVNIGTGNDYFPLPLFSICTWIRTPGLGSGMTKAGILSITYGLGFGLNGSGNFDTYMDNGSSSPHAIITQNLFDNKFHHLCLTYDGVDRHMYIDGIKRLTQATTWLGTTRWPTNGAAIGHDANNPPVYKFNGFIDEVKIYPYARTTDEIKADYIAGAASAGSSAVIGSPPETGGQFSEGLVGYWKMDESGWTNDCNTATVFDSSGNSNSGAACPVTTGPTGGAVGKFGNGGDFDGSGDYIQISDNDNFSFGNGSSDSEFSVSAWINMNDATSFRAINRWVSTGSSDAEWIFGTNPSDQLQFAVYDDNNSNYCLKKSTSAITTYENQWVHILATYDGRGGSTAQNGISIYINGDKISNTTDATSGSYVAMENLSLPLNIAGLTGLSSYANGSIDEVRIYNRALSPAEVQDLYNWAPGPITYYKFDEGSGTQLTDSSGNNNNSTSFVGSPSWSKGKIGGALYFNGTSNAVSLPGSALPATQKTTICTWAKGESESRTNSVFEAGDVSGNRVANVHINYSNGNTYWDFGDTIYDRISQANNTSTYNNWNHWCFLADNETDIMTIYLNGGVWLSAGHAKGLSTQPTYFHLGSNDTGDATWYKGWLDEFKIYNYARTAGQIIEDMNAGHPAPGSLIGSAVSHWKFNEGYGDTANDSGFGGNSGDLAGACPGAATCPTWSNSGKFDKALDFDGTDDYMSLSSTNETALKSDVSTISLWAFIRSTGPNAYAELYAVTGGNKTGIKWETSKIGIDANGDFYNYYVSTSLSYNTWNHIVVEIDRTIDKAKVYINGVYQGQTNAWTTYTPTATSVTIGKNALTGNSGDYLDGLIDEVKIYNYALTEDEVRVDMNRGSALVLGSEDSKIATEGLILHLDAGNSESYPGSGNIWYDLSKQSADATLYDSPYTTEDGYSTMNFSDGSKYAIQNSYTYDDNYTIEAFTKMKSSSITWRTLLRTSPNDHPVIVNTGGSLGMYDNNNGGSFADSSYDITGGQWLHLVAVGSGPEASGTTTFYINGKKVGTSNRSVSGNAQNAIGAVSGGGQPWGWISIFRVYDRKLTQTEIQGNFKTQAGRFGIDTDNTEPIAEWKFDEKTSITANDTSGNGNTGTLTNMEATDWKSSALCKVGACLNFDGNTTYVDAGTSVSDTMESAGTIGMWVYPTAIGGLFSRSTGTGWLDERLVLHVYGGKVDLTMSNGSSYWRHQSTSALPINQWSYVVVTWDGSNVKHYFNGKLDRSQAQGGTPELTGVKTWIGRVEGLAPNHHTGLIDQVCIYDYARTPAQIAWDYNRGAPIGWWKLDKGEGLTAYDSSGNENNGALTGSMTNDDWVSGKVNTALEFDGGDDRVVITNNSETLMGTSDYAISAWVKTTDDDCGIYRDSSSWYAGPWLELYSGKTRAKLGWADGSIATSNAIKDLDDGIWHHVLANYDRSGLLQIYVDGQIDAYADISSHETDDIANTSSAQIGYALTYCSGSVDDVRIYNYALTETQTKNLYNDGSAIRFSGE